MLLQRDCMRSCVAEVVELLASLTLANKLVGRFSYDDDDDEHVNLTSALVTK